MDQLVKVVRNALWAVTGIVMVLNVEAVAATLKLDKLLVTPGLLQKAVELIRHPATLILAILIFGVIAGVVGAKFASRLRDGRADPNQKLHDLGYRMRESAAQLSNIEQWGDIAVRDHEKREVVAEVNSISLDAHRLGLAFPKPDSQLLPLINYLTEVGNWLSRGELDLAKQRATVLAKG